MSPTLVAASIALLIPLNVLIFAIDNAMFLWYPYRLNQEGIAIFLRTTLTFTAKGVLFFLALVFTVFWAHSCGVMADVLNARLHYSVDHRVVFGIGMWLFVLCLGLREYHSGDEGIHAVRPDARHAAVGGGFSARPGIQAD